MRPLLHMLRVAVDDWSRCRTIRRYQLRRDVLAENLPTFPAKW